MITEFLSRPLYDPPPSYLKHGALDVIRAIIFRVANMVLRPDLLQPSPVEIQRTANSPSSTKSVENGARGSYCEVVCQHDP